MHSCVKMAKLFYNKIMFKKYIRWEFFPSLPDTDLYKLQQLCQLFTCRHDTITIKVVSTFSEILQKRLKFRPCES